MSADRILDVLGYARTGARDDFHEPGFYLIELQSKLRKKWSVFLADGSQFFQSIGVEQATTLSADGEVLYFWCSDTVMASELICYRQGEMAWAVTYDCEDELGLPRAHGDVPASVQARIDACPARSPDDEWDASYEVTADAALELVGFRHAIELETDDDEPFQVLSPRVRE